MNNATYLTQNYPGMEESFWTPCIEKFLIEHTVKLPISVCIPSQTTAPWYTSRKSSPFIEYDKVVAPEPYSQKGISGSQLLKAINDRFKVNLKPDDFVINGNKVYGVSFDIVLLSDDTVYLLENKPYGHSTLDGNQGARESYHYFVDKINKMGIRCQLIYIFSVGVNTSFYESIKSLQEDMGELYGIILLEHLFSIMHEEKYVFNHRTICWSDYSESAPDYLESF